MIENFRIVKGLWLLMNAVNYFILYFVLVSIMVKEIRTSIGQKQQTIEQKQKQKRTMFLKRHLIKGRVKIVKWFVIPYKFPGTFIAKGSECDLLCTQNLVPKQSVYGQKRITFDNGVQEIEYRVWNPYRSKVAAAVLGGVKGIYIKPGSKVLYLGASMGNTVSYISDIIGSEGVVYAVEISKRVGKNLVHMAKKRTNVVPIIHDARKPLEYRYLVGMVDIVFVDIARPDQAKITAENCKYFLKNGGHFMISIKAKCIDCTRHPNIAFANEVNILKQLGLTPEELLTLEPYENGHAMVLGSFRNTSFSQNQL